MEHNKIIEEFSKQYNHLKKFGLEASGIVNWDYDNNINVISVSTPFIFDKTKLPKTFMGLDIREGISGNTLPPEFQVSDRNDEYIWAYQRFEEYVNKHSDLVRKALDNPNMMREEMLDAICFGDFKKHKEKCIVWEKEGKIPKYINHKTD